MRRARTVVLFSALAAVAVLAAAPVGSAARACKSLTLGQNGSGRTLTLHPCDQVTIRLRQQFDGGYQWKVSHRPARGVLKLISATTVLNTPKGAVGGSDTRVFRYRAVGKGTTSLKLTEARSFQAHSQIAKFRLTVRVA